MEYQQDEAPNTAIPTAHPSRIFPVPGLGTLLTAAVVGFLLYAFFSGLTLKFYASIVFAFYSVTQSLWISVILLGVFQTMLLVPLRIVSLHKSTDLKDFENTVKTIEAEKEKAGFLKKSVKGGRKVALFYVVNFFAQVISYLSIGRLFRIDFYQHAEKLQNLLFDWVPFPSYPLEDLIFKIPYVWFTDTYDIGFGFVLIAWGIIWLFQAVVFLVRTIRKRQLPTNQPVNHHRMPRLVATITGSTVLLMLLSLILLRNFPVDWVFRVLTGDIAHPHITLSIITSVVATFTIIWINLPKITKQVELARAAGISEEAVWRTQKELFQLTLRNALVVGLGAYLVATHIPSAFKLSVFTLALISLLSPLTLDRVILKTVKPPETTQAPDANKSPDKEAQAKPVGEISS